MLNPEASSSASRGSSGPTLRIAFHVVEPFHHEVLDPVYNLLKDDFPCLLSADQREIVVFKPDVLLLSQLPFTFWREHLPDTRIVFLRHGFSSKNTGGKCMAGADYACVTSQWSRDQFINEGFVPRHEFWVTGFIPLDPLLSVISHQPGAPALAPHPLAKTSGPTLLYAPTHNPLLSSAPCFLEDWIAPLRAEVPNLRIIIKPHPVTAKNNPEWIAAWSRLAQHDPRVHLVTDTHSSIYTLLPHADVLFTDVSSVMFYFLALDRPIILFANPDHTRDPNFNDPTGPEWAWRDMARSISSPHELANAMREAIRHPDARADRRALYRERVFGTLLDGRAAERVAEHIRSLQTHNPVTASDDTEEWADLDHRHLVSLLRSLGDQVAILNREVSRLRCIESSLAVRFAIKTADRLERMPLLRNSLRKLISRFMNRSSPSTATNPPSIHAESESPNHEP
ncbi:MAG TPA: CDP-glycerol glycerophosphotransferase family protein [Phycisphaerales bacterium]|nr:CDP-glycerol glycerophosphotransferase family protein [Phycisphaerales bacterium]